MPVCFLPEPEILGVLVEVEEGQEHPDGWLFVVWEDDDYFCVLEPELVGVP